MDDLKETRGYWKLKEEALDLGVCENSLWKRLWTCRKTDYETNEDETDFMKSYEWPQFLTICEI
jgi:hypothetical protein